MPGAVELVFFRFLEIADRELIEQFVQYQSVQGIDVHPRQLAGPHSLHGGLVACAPCIGKGSPVDVQALLRAERTAFADKAAAPVDDGTENIKDEGEYLGIFHFFRHGGHSIGLYTAPKKSPRFVPRAA